MPKELHGTSSHIRDTGIQLTYWRVRGRGFIEASLVS